MVQAQNVAGLSKLIGSQPSPIDNWISNGTTYINKPPQIRFHLKRVYTITKIYDNIKMDDTIAVSMNAHC